MPALLLLRRPGACLALLVLALVAAVAPAGTALAGRPSPPPPPARLTLTPDAGTVGTAVTAAGTGFPKRAVITISAASATWTARSDGAGAFTSPVAVPEAAAGPLQVTATAGSVTASATVEVLAPPLAPAPAPARRLTFGVSTPGGFHDATELDTVAGLAGEAPSVVVAFSDFTRPLDLAGLQAVRDRGAVPLLTWEPWAAGGGTDQPGYALDRVAAGEFDGHLTEWGRGLASFGGPVMLRFAHEMNGNWYPWSEGVNGNGPGDYVAAWRHVHDVVTAAGATDVQWVWAPNVPYPGSTPLAGLYPGDAYVDVVGLDGYNFGTSQAWSAWRSPEALFGPGLGELRAVAPAKPIVIAETASTELGGDKAAWISSLFAYLSAPEQADVTAFVWFHHLKETDWRIDSSPAAADAFRTALQARA